MKLLHLIEMTVDQAVKIFVTHGEDVRGADAKRVKSARNALVRKFQNDLRTGGESDLKLINAAYDVLKNGVPVDRPYRSSRPDADADRSYYRTKPADEPSRQDYTDVRYLKQHIAELARASGGKVREWTLWGFDGYFFRHVVTVWGCPEVFKDMAEAMYKWQTGGGNSYSCRAVFVTKNDTPGKIWLIYADDQMYDLDSPVFEFDSFNMNPGNDQSFVRKLPKLLDDLFDPEDDDEGPLKERAQPNQVKSMFNKGTWNSKTHGISEGAGDSNERGIPANIQPTMGIKVGKNARFFRGESESSGSNGATYGAGLYTTTNRGYAAKFGKVRELSRWDALPDNPLRFRTIQDWELWLQRYDQHHGILGARDRGQKHNDIGDYIRILFPDADGVQIGLGNDAIFVAWPTNESVTEEGGSNIPGLIEAPIGDYALVGNWGDKEASNSFRPTHRIARLSRVRT